MLFHKERCEKFEENLDHMKTICKRHFDESTDHGVFKLDQTDLEEQRESEKATILEAQYQCEKLRMQICELN